MGQIDSSTFLSPAKRKPSLGRRDGGGEGGEAVSNHFFRDLVVYAANTPTPPVGRCARRSMLVVKYETSWLEKASSSYATSHIFQKPSVRALKTAVHDLSRIPSAASYEGRERIGVGLRSLRGNEG